MKVRIDTLKPYPFQAEVYGTHDCSPTAVAEMEELVASISQNGVLEPIITDEEGHIIAGTRRVEACKRLHIEEIDADVRTFTTEIQKILTFFSSNMYRTKTVEQKTREAIFLKTAYAKHAEEARKSQSNPEHVTVDENFRNMVSREALGKLVGMSGRTLAKSERVVTRIDELEAAGEKDKAQLLRDKLETNISGAEAAANGPIVDKVPLGDSREKKAPPKHKLEPEEIFVYDEATYWYWRDFRDLELKLRSTHARLAGKCNHAMDENFLGMVSSIEKLAEGLAGFKPPAKESDDDNSDGSDSDSEEERGEESPSHNDQDPEQDPADRDEGTDGDGSGSDSGSGTGDVLPGDADEGGESGQLDF